MPTFADACAAVLSDPDGDHSLYTTLAPLYDRVAASAGSRYDAQVRAVAERVPTSARSVLNAGCGVGRLLPMLADRHGAVVGVDDSAELLSLAADRVAAAGGVSLVEADVSAPDLDLDRRFDAAVALDHLTGRLHGDALDRGLATLRRHLHDGGTVVVDAAADERAVREPSPSVFRDERYVVERAVDAVVAGDGTGDLRRVSDYRVTDRRTGETAVARERESIRTFDGEGLAAALRRAGFRGVTVEADAVEEGSLVADARV
ncbi:class I SAM-dependent methyltransferase [Halobaculum sp. EA56]|uniref:class I SAM-dependent methyltransferase n=1 Tax=Halobaculum sp. EA56 TaxID=3421648 RepID=UPI003EB783EC